MRAPPTTLSHILPLPLPFLLGPSALHRANMVTPCCGTVFEGFDACFSIKCPSCPMYFCGWCLQHVSDTSGANHQHVRTCPLNPHPGAVYGDYVRWRDDHVPRKRLRRVKEEVRDVGIKLRETLGRIATDVKTVAAAAHPPTARPAPVPDPLLNVLPVPHPHVVVDEDGHFVLDGQNVE